MSVVRRAAGACAAVALLASCGSDSDDDATTVTDAPAADSTDTTVPQVTEAPPATDAATEDAGEGTDADGDTGGDASTEEPPAENTGTVTVAGTTYDLTGDDFLICETVNPAFDDAVNIQTRFDVEPGEVVILGDTIQEQMELGVLGDLPDGVTVDAGDAALFPNPAEEVEVTRDGRTVSGTATIIDERVGASVTEDNPLQDTTIEFSFTC